MFAAGVVLARSLGSSDLGAFTLLLTIAAFATSFSTFGVPQATTQQLASDEGHARDIAFTSLVVISCLSIVCSLFLVLGSSWIAEDVYKSPLLSSLLPIVAGFVLLYSLYQFLLAVLQGLHAIRVYNYLLLGTSVLYLVTVAIGASQYGLVGAVWANSIYLLFALVFMVRPVLRGLTRRSATSTMLSWEFQPKVLRFAAFLTVGGTVAYFAQWFGPTLLIRSHSYSALGEFRVATLLSANLMVIPLAVATPLFPSLASTYARNRPQFISLAVDSFRLVSLVTLPLAAALCLFSRDLLELVFGGTYGGASQLLFLMSMSGFLMAINSNAGSLYFGTGEMFVSMVLNGVWGLMFCLFGALLIPRFSSAGLGMAYLLSYAILTAIQLSYQRVKWGIRFENLTWVIAGTGLLFGLSYLIQIYTAGLLHNSLACLILLLLLSIEIRFLRAGEREFLRRIMYLVWHRGAP